MSNRFGSLIMEHFSPMVGGLPVFTDDQLSRLKMPILYLAGEQDATVDAGQCAHRLKQQAPQAITILLKNHGHVVYDVLDQVMPFLSTIGW